MNMLGWIEDEAKTKGAKRGKHPRIEGEASVGDGPGKSKLDNYQKR